MSLPPLEGPFTHSSCELGQPWTPAQEQTYRRDEQEAPSSGRRAGPQVTSHLHILHPGTTSGSATPLGTSAKDTQSLPASGTHQGTGGRHHRHRLSAMPGFIGGLSRAEGAGRNWGLVRGASPQCTLEGCFSCPDSSLLSASPPNM